MQNKLNDHFIENINIHNKNVICRVDWNVPYDKDTFQIISDFRITSSLKTINYLLEKGAKRICIISHLGRPDGYDKKYSWKPFISQIQKYFKTKICFLKHGIHKETINKLDNTSNTIYLLENIRFHKEETNLSDNSITKLFQQMGDLYVSDAFGSMHRKHLSIVGYKGVSRAYGYLVRDEIQSLNTILKNKKKKVLAIIGGGKMTDKLKLLESLSHVTDGIYITGGNINSIIKDTKYSKYIKSITNNRAKIYMMSDGIAGKTVESEHNNYYCTDELPQDMYFFDSGIRSIIQLDKIIKKYDIIFWNGTLGIVENNKYNYGSTALVHILLKSNKQIIVGGGDTAAFVNKFAHNFDHISTGGGSFIEYISHGGTLPGIEYFES